jgi:predicted transcriptional regulator
MIEDGYSICLNRWALDPRIKNELPILLIISTLVAKTGVCYAKNRFFADMFGIDETNVSKKIKKLIECGYIEIEYKKRGAEIVNRQIRLAKIPTDDWQKYQR